MTTKENKTVFRTPAGDELSIMPGAKKKIPLEELLKQRKAWYEKYKHLLSGYSVDQFLEEKHRDVEAGLE